MFTSPAVAVPFWLGLIDFLICAAVGTPTSFAGLIGLGAMILGTGVAGFRWLLGRENLWRQAQQDLEREARRSQQARIRRLFRGLRKDEDSRTNQYLQTLDQLHSNLEQIALADRDRRAGILPEVCRQADALYQSCLASLERTLDLWQTAQNMPSSDIRKQLLDSREQVLGELGESIDYLSRTIGHLQLSSVRGEHEATLAETREQLRIGLEVARKVEERMDQLDKDLRGGTLSQET